VWPADGGGGGPGGGGGRAGQRHRQAAVRRKSLAQGGTLQKGSSGKASRSIEEIKLVFERNKGAIYALYNRALRDDPALQGKVVLELKIAPERPGAKACASCPANSRPKSWRKSCWHASGSSTLAPRTWT
jgi:hypothetical protein